MNDDQFDDLKQFIDARISQTETLLKAEFTEQLQDTNARIDVTTHNLEQLCAEMHDGFSGVGEAIDQLNERLDERDKEVDQRLTKLEQQIAA